MTRPRLWDAVYFTKDATKRSLALYGNQTRDPRTQLRSGLEAMLRWAHEQPEAAK